MNLQKTKKPVYINDNPVDIKAFTIFLIAISMQLLLFYTFMNSDDMLHATNDTIDVIAKGMFAIVIIMMSIFLFSTKKELRMIGNQYRKGDSKYYFYAIISYFAIQILILAVDDIFFQVSVWEIYFYYITAGVIEEVIYRSALIRLFQGIVLIFIKTKSEKKRMIPMLNIISIFLSGFVFALVHTRYYGNVGAMTITFLGGCSQAYWYLKTKDLTVPIIAHVMINFVGAHSIVATL